MLYFIVGAIVVIVLIISFTITIRVSRVSRLNLGLLAFGAFFGLISGALLSVPLGKLPTPYGNILPLAVTLIMTVVAVAVAASSRIAVAKIASQWRTGRPTGAQSSASGVPGIVVDTSVIIDGRIGDIARAGFVPGRLLVPRFVLAELQNIADSSDAMRRGRGRRGLEVLNTLRATDDVEVEVVDQDFPDIKEVDAKLVHLGKILGAHILTTDYNLNRVAQIEGVRVLNVNELSNAVRPVVLPGERMMVKVVQAGKEKGQGVGYLPDGTMIVVDKGDKMIGQEVQTEITRVFQTVAGKMLFAAPVDLKTGTAVSPSPSVQSSVISTPDTPVSKPVASHRGGNGRHRDDRRGPAIRLDKAAPRAAQAHGPRQDNKPLASRPSSGSRRVSPVQRLENSLMELTGDSKDPK